MVIVVVIVTVRVASSYNNSHDYNIVRVIVI